MMLGLNVKNSLVVDKLFLVDRLPSKAFLKSILLIRLNKMN